MTAIGTGTRRSKSAGTEVAGPEIVIATLMRETGASGVQSHVETLRTFARTTSQPTTLVTPFSARSPLLTPVFAARMAVRLASRPAAVWWYRYWHGRYLRAALSHHLTHTGAAVVYAQDPVSAAAALQARSFEPVVMAVHFNLSQADEWAHKGDLAEGGRAFASIRSLEDDVLPRLDGLVYVSQFTRSVLEERLPALLDVPGVVVPNCVDVTRRPASRPVADLVTVGALEPNKNQEYLLEVLAAAARRGHRFTLTVIGDGPDRARLESHAARLRVSDQVRFAGYQPDPRPLVAAHRLYCHAARMESFGIALVEAMAEGLPVLAAPSGGIREIVRPGVNGALWPLDDPQEGAHRLVALLSDEAGLQAMGLAARTMAVREFSREVQSPRLVDFLLSAKRQG